MAWTPSGAFRCANALAQSSAAGDATNLAHATYIPAFIWGIGMTGHWLWTINQGRFGLGIALMAVGAILMAVSRLSFSETITFITSVSLRIDSMVQIVP